MTNGGSQGWTSALKHFCISARENVFLIFQSPPLKLRVEMKNTEEKKVDPRFRDGKILIINLNITLIIFFPHYEFL